MAGFFGDKLAAVGEQKSFFFPNTEIFTNFVILVNLF